MALDGDGKCDYAMRTTASVTRFSREDDESDDGRNDGDARGEGGHDRSEECRFLELPFKLKFSLGCRIVANVV